jgi:predicted alpha-1,2-mannosidase
MMSVFFLFAIGCSNNRVSTSNSESFSPSQQVYPYLDAANSRWFYFSSACRPFGMVNLSPDTELGGAWGSGYRYNSDTIKGFSHIHAWQLSGLSVMPISGKNTVNLSVQDINEDYYSVYTHTNEEVSPGYHRVFLERYETMVELSSTTRVGMHKYTFPCSDGNKILVQMGGSLGPSNQMFGEIERVNQNEFKGHIISEKTFRRPKDVPIYFYLVLNTNVESIDVWHENEIILDTDHVSGKKTGAILNLASTSKPVLMKVGISYTSVENAKQNINTELNHWDFEKTKQESENEWDSWLGKIKIEGGTKEDRSRFYTDLWKALQGRRIISDANGSYADMTGEQLQIKQIPLDENGKPKFNHYNSDAFWGAQWTINTLWSLVYPKMTSEFCNSFLNYYTNGGLIPRGPSGGNYTFVMTGASSTPFFVSAYQKGIRDFDIEKAYEGLRKNHMPGGLMSYSGYEHENTGSGGVDKYIELGYVPYPYKEESKAFHRKGAGQTLEYAYQDWTLAQLARELGKEQDYNYFMKRSGNYKNIYDSVLGYMHPRGIDGKWLEPFSPSDYENGFVESNSYQMTWYVMHDYAGLAQLMGGYDKATEKLNKQFEIAQANGFTSGKKHADELHTLGRKTPINYGNQPSSQTAFIFNELGAPWLTQKWSRAVIDSVYSGLSPEQGFSGDEDQGLMGSLSVLMKIGLFQPNGGTDKDPVYQIGSPIFDFIEINLSDTYYSGKTFSIQAKNNNKQNVYIQSIKLNGKNIERLYLRHSEIINGGTLELEMGSIPNKKLGSINKSQLKSVLN